MSLYKELQKKRIRSLSYDSASAAELCFVCCAVSCLRLLTALFLHPPSTLSSNPPPHSLSMHSFTHPPYSIHRPGTEQSGREVTERDHTWPPELAVGMADQGSGLEGECGVARCAARARELGNTMCVFFDPPVTVLALLLALCLNVDLF